MKMILLLLTQVGGDAVVVQERLSTSKRKTTWEVRSMGLLASGKLSRRGAVHQPHQPPTLRTDELRREPLGLEGPLQNRLQGHRLVLAGHQEDHERGAVEGRNRQGDAVAAEPADPVGDREAPGFVQRLGAREERTRLFHLSVNWASPTSSLPL
jgi:hypothetical protein